MTDNNSDSIKCSLNKYYSYYNKFNFDYTSSKIKNQPIVDSLMSNSKCL